MGLRFRKSFPLGKLYRLNVSKSGLSVGVGPRGFNVNIGPQGIRRTVGIPGTGMYYQDAERWPKSDSVSSANASATSDSHGLGWILIVVVALILFAVAYQRGNKSTSSNSAALPPVAAPQVVAPAPVSDRPLTHSEVVELQVLLRKQGFNPGVADGTIGPRTRAAAQAFARARGLPAPTEPTLQFLEAARSR